MLKEYRTVYEGGEGRIEEKKSKFIATVYPIENEVAEGAMEEVLALIEKTKKRYWDARHNCFAYCIGLEQEILRCSDDGEPAGTAGKPMLDVLTGMGIHNVLVVVTRYFGGTLLGTGGLVRAYSGAVKEGLANSVVITKKFGVKMDVLTDYTGLGKIQYILGKRGLKVLDSVYTDAVEVRVLIPVDEVDCVLAEITEGTNGQARYERGEECYFAEVDGEMIVFGE
ncbi:MAG: YigZ family protein [Hespellia sp.]|nr:YigZ family protein [Hespellia sp.]